MQAARQGRSISGVGKAQWENSEFPIVCETCLGQNPFVRMMKNEFFKECKICSRPFTVFRWKPGSNARYKKTEICQICAKLKNCCQTCLLDLEFGLPLQLRDQLASASGQQVEIPKSEMNREYYAQHAAQRVAAGESMATSKAQSNETLLRLARTTPYYKRNEAHICSFWAKGQCTRGDSCPYKHENPKDKDDPLAKQNIKDRYHGQNDPVAEKMLRRAEPMLSRLEPPSDTSITTLYIGNIPATTTEKDIRDLFYAYGEIKSIKVSGAQHCAFVTYTAREDAENAMEKCPRTSAIQDCVLNIQWGRPQPSQAATGSLPVPPPLPTVNGIPVEIGSNPVVAPPPPPRPSKFPPPPPKAAAVEASKPLYPSMDPSRLGARVAVDAPHRAEK